MRRPLADTIRPETIDSMVGQQTLVGTHGLVTILLEKAKKTTYFPSLILWGPPGCGKTSLARIIAKSLEREFYEFSAVNTSIKDIEKIIPLPGPQASLLQEQAPIIFIDEIHRFNKAQQDSLLPHVEKGSIILLGATTENPSFSVIRALLSRCKIISLQPLSQEDLDIILEKGLEELPRKISREAKDLVLHTANGDARSLLNTIEMASQLSESIILEVDSIKQALQTVKLGFDKGGEEFYNTISAFHKSIRGSDPNAALYWLARMLEAGQDPLYVARRLIRIASEDIGNINPQALQIANNAYDSCQRLGLPECDLSLAQATAFLASSPKSNVLYRAYKAAVIDATEQGNLPVPLHIRNASTAYMKAEGYGKEYEYFHSPTGQKNPDICYFPELLGEKNYLGIL